MNCSFRKLAECCQVITKGTTPTSFGMSFSDSGIPFLRVQNIQRGTVELNGDALFVDLQTHKTLERSRIHRGDVLLSIAGTIGRSGVVPDSAPVEMNCNQAVAIIRVQDNLDRRFLLHWLNTPEALSQMTGGVVTGTIANLSLTQVRNLNVPLPTLPDQRRIAAVLDQADALRAKRRAALAELDTLTQSLFLDLFGDPAANPKDWPIRRLGELIIDGPQNGLYKPSTDYGSGTPILRIDAFYDGAVTDISALKRVRLTDAEASSFQLTESDVVINRVNSLEYLGKCALIPELPEQTVFESNMMRMRFDPNTALPQFVVQFLQTGFAKSQIQTRAKHAVNQASINQQDVSDFRVNLPPIELQCEFARRATAVERLRTAQRASLTELDALFASLQHRAFTGQLPPIVRTETTYRERFLR